MRAWLVAPLLIVACSIELEPVASRADGGANASGSGGKDASTDACATALCGNGGSGGSTGGSAGAGAGATGGTGATGGGGQAGMSGASGVGATGGSGGSGGSGAGGTGGTGPSFACYDVYTIVTWYDGQQYPCDAPSPGACRCNGCYEVCEDQWGPVSDCVCPICAGSQDCQSFCYKDGLCDPYAESCSCSDCVGHPLCP